MLKYKNKWVFISFEQGASGHRLARVIASAKCVYWYSNPSNGINPWNVSSTSTIRQRGVSKYHFDRLVPDGKLPPPWDYVKDYFTTYEEYWPIFKRVFVENGGIDIIDNYNLLYPTHSRPNFLRTHFPNCKIINVLHDVEKCTNRYMETTANFPGWVRHKDVVPEDNAYLQFLRSLKQQREDFLIKDVWAQNKYSTWYTDSMYNELQNEIREDLEIGLQVRKAVPNWDNRTVSITTHPKREDWLPIKELLGNA